MKPSYSRPVVFASANKPRVKQSADRIAHDELFCAVKSFFDGLSDSQREALASHPGRAALESAYVKASERAVS